MNDPNLNTLLKWGVENSQASADSTGPRTQLNQEALQALFGGNRKSDADLMRENMEVIKNDDATLEDRLTAFDNFEQLIENLDNANNMEPLGLWQHLVNQLENPEAELRAFAAWCCGTAVQNNVRTQERLLILGAIPTLVRMATKDIDRSVRKKAILALSSSIRNFQPGLDAAVPHLPAKYRPEGVLDANDMESVDKIITPLRENL